LPRRTTVVRVTQTPPARDDPPVPASLPPPQTMALDVGLVRDLGPTFREIRLQGAALYGFRFAPGQDLMLRLPWGNGELVSRRYTFRRADPVAGTADLNVVMHGDGPAPRWAQSVRPGQTLQEAVGPRGKITLDAAAEWHLFIGDETYVPGTLAMLEALTPEALAGAVLEVPDAADEQPFASQPSKEIRWLHRHAAAPGDPRRLVEALRGWHSPPGRGHVYIAAELRVALALRDELLAQGFPRNQISAKGYWSRERANAIRGEPDDLT